MRTHVRRPESHEGLPTRLLQGLTSHRRLLLTCTSLALAAACTRRPPETIARVVGETERRGPWVPPSGYEFFVRAELHAQQGEFQSAVEAYEMARSGIDDPYVIAREVEAALHIPNLTLAESLITEGLRSTPESEALLLARAHLAAANHDDALEGASLREANRVAPRSTESLFALVTYLEAHGGSDEATALLESFADALSGTDGALDRARHVAVLRAQLERAVLAQDVAQGARVARALVALSPVHRPEVLRFISQAMENQQPLLAHAVLRALPMERSELALRFRVARAANDRGSAERIALDFDDGTLDGSLAAADAWLALGDAARAEETAMGAWLTTQAPRARDLVIRARIAQGHLHEALALFEDSHSPEARLALCDALDASALPALAAEVCPPADASEAH